MDLITLLIIMMIVMIIIGVPLAILIRKSKFRNIAMIARQTGQDPNDVIWLRDMFKVHFNDGTWEIQFYKMREKTQSIDGRFWTKFIKNSSSSKILKYTKEQWEKFELGRHVRRGVYFYETTEGEFYPLTIEMKDNKKNKIPVFAAVNQDNRQFVARETQDVNSLVRNKKKENMILILIIVAIIALVLIFALGGYWENSQREKSMSALAGACSEYAKGEFAYIQNVTLAMQERPSTTYLTDAMNKVGGK